MTTQNTQSRSTTTRPRLILAVVCVTQFMVILDSSIVNVALPSIRGALHFATNSLGWVVNAYLLTFAGLMLLGGRTVDLFGARRMVSIGLVLFTGASLIGGVAQSPEVLVTSRAVQGIGAAFMAPTTLAIINTHFTKPGVRARAFGMWSAAGGVGGMAGAIAGGALTSLLSWRGVFLINVPIGTVLIWAALAALAPSRVERESRLDLGGAVLGTAALAALVFGIMQVPAHGWAAPLAVWPVLAAVPLLAGFVLVESRGATYPILPLRVLSSASVSVGGCLLVLFGAVAISMWYFTSLYLQDVLHYSALGAGLGQTPAAVLFVGVARVAAALLPRLGTRRMIWLGCAFVLAGFGWLSRAGAQGSYLTGILGPTLLVATGIGLTFPTLMAAATASAADRDRGIVGGLASTANQIGNSLGLAALVSLSGTVAGRRAVPGSTEALAHGYGAVFVAAAGLAIVIAAVSLRLRPSASTSQEGSP